MSGIKKLAGQTMWYGVSSIAARFINYLLTPYLTLVLLVENYGRMSLVYAAIPLINVIFTFGFETTYFRFSNKDNENSVYSTASISLFGSTLFFGSILWMFRDTIAAIAAIPDADIIIQYTILIICLDTLSTLPFARLRFKGRPVKFALVRILSIFLNVGATVFFLSYCPKILAANPDSWIGWFYTTDINPVFYVVLANVLQSAFTLLLLSGEIGSMKITFNPTLWKQMVVYALPLIVAGMGGMINETFDRIFLKMWIPGDHVYRDAQIGIYSACYKLAILITLFIQAFRMGAEPFFFKQAEAGNPQRTYARVMKFFVIIMTFMFLVVALFLPIWRHFINERYWAGLAVVPILLIANIFLGIYYNLSIWYKLGNKTRAGAYITLIGAAVTILINWLFIPSYGYVASAWATFFCYGSMMGISYVWGQKEYKVPYASKKLMAYIVIVVLLFFVYKGITYFIPDEYAGLTVSLVLLLVYGWFILLVERKEFQRLPFVGRFLK